MYIKENMSAQSNPATNIIIYKSKHGIINID